MPQSLALGYRSDWAARLGGQIAERAPFGHELVLPRNQVGELLECTGLWRGERRCENSPFVSQSILQAQLTKRLCREWLRETGTEVGLWPFQFVGQALNDFDSMTLPIRQWIGPQAEEERTETIGEIAAVIARVADELGHPDAPTEVAVCDQMSAQIDDLLLVANDVDLIIGQGEKTDGVYWPGAVLIGFVPDRPTGEDLDALAFSALMYSLNHGGPPARVVSYGLLSGKGMGLEVERDWVELAAGGVCAALPKLLDCINGADFTLTPGEHCRRCPDHGNCPFSQMDTHMDWEL